MRVHLFYDGPLPSGVRDTDRGQAIKHDMRKRFSSALRRRWTQQNPTLMDFYTRGLPELTFSENKFCGDDPAKPFFRVLTNGYFFIPLITRRNRLLCELVVTIHRREGAFSPVTGGDLDNRIKTLFDALRMPRRLAEIPGHLAGDGTSEMFCLLEDDSLISRLCVNTASRTDYDEAKPSPSPDAPEDPVRLDIEATLKADESEFPHTALPADFLLGA
jgi:hypothetical protein